MTYPPQPGQPGPHGQQPPAGQYGQYGQVPPQPQYGGPGGEPPKSRRGVLIAVLAGVLVLAVGGPVVWLLTKDGASSNNASQDTTSGQADPTSRDNPTSEAPSTSQGQGAADPNAVSAVAQEYVTAVNGADEAAATQLTCEKSSPGTLYEVVAGNEQVQAGEVTMVSDDTATVGITLEGGTSASTPLRLLLEDGGWCVAI